MNRREQLWAIVLAAGSGQRLESYLRRQGHAQPIKQFCAVIGRRTMLQHTWHRVEMRVPPERVVTVVDAGHGERFRGQLGARSAGSVVYQPANRETAPGVLLPLAHVLRVDPDAVVAIFPSDHFVAEEARFMAHVQVAELVIRRRLADVAVLGVQAEHADTDYGWIETRRAGRHPESGVLPVERFWEKPEPLVAQRLYDGGHLWSTMVTIARGARLWELVCDAQPRLRRPFERILHAIGSACADRETRAVYEDMPSVSLSSGVFERVAPCLAAVAVRGVQWSDWGREERVAETLCRLGRGSDSSQAGEIVSTTREAMATTRVNRDT